MSSRPDWLGVTIGSRKLILPLMHLTSLALLALPVPAPNPTVALVQETIREDWPIFRGDPGLSGRAATVLGDQLELLWSVETGGAITSSPVVAGQRVYVGSDDQKLWCVDFESGEALWTFETEDMIEAPPLVAEGKVFVGSSDFFLYAVDAESGELAWKYETGEKVLGGANLLPADGELGARIVVGSYDNRVYCLDAATGEEVWVYETANYVNGTPAIVNGQVVFGGCDAVLHFVNGKTGQPTATLELCGDCHVAGSVASAEGRVYLGHYGNAFLCADLERAEVLWNFEDPRYAFFSSAAIGDDRVVFGGRNKRLHCVRIEDGELLWDYKTRRKVDASPVIAGDKVVFGSADGRLHILRLEDGEELWTWDLGSETANSPAVVRGRVLVGALDHKLYAFGPAARAVPEGETVGGGR